MGEVRSLNTFVTSIRELRAVENCKVTGEDTVAVGEDSDADLNEETVCPQQQLLVDIVLRCIYFLSTPSSPIMVSHRECCNVTIIHIHM